MRRALLTTVFGLMTPLLLQATEETAYPGNPLVTPGSYYVSGQGLARIDPVTGTLRWRVLTQERLHEPVMAGTRILTAGEGGVIGLDAASGRVDWRRDLGSPAFSPVRNRDTAYVATRDGRLWALVSETGQERWNSRLGSGWIYPPAVVGDLVITGGQDAVVWALDRETGVTRWSRKLPQELVYSPLAAGPGLVVVTTFSGAVIALDGRSGEVRWQARFRTPSLSPLAAGRRLLLPGMDGILRAVDLSSGDLLWQRSLAGRLVAPLAEHQGVLLALTDNGEGIFLDAEQGTVIHRRALPGDPMAGDLISKNAAIIFITTGNSSSPTPVMLNVF